MADIKKRTGLFVFLFVILFLSCNNNQIISYSIKEGSTDLSGWNWDLSPVIVLTGDFKFKPGPLEKEYLDSDYDDSAWDTLRAPGDWNSLIPSKTGRGCYRLSLTLGEDNELTFRLNSELSNCTFYINGTQVHTNPGGLSSIKYAESSGVYIPLRGMNKVSILLYVENEYFHTGGLFNSLILGKERIINVYFQEKLVFDLIFLGILFTTGLYHIILWLNRRRDKAALFFGAFCLILFSRFFIAVSRSAVEFIALFGFIFDEPYFIQKIIMRFELFSMVMGVVCFLGYLSNLFSQEFENRIFKWMVRGIIGAVLFTFIVPTLYFDVLRFIYLVLMIISSVFALILLGFAWKNKQDSIEILFIGFLIFVFTIFIDFVILNTSFRMIQIGITLFIFSQSLLLARRFSNTYRKMEYLTRNLQHEVEKKTESLQKQAKETERANQAKSEFLSSMSHELRTPLNAILGYSQIIEGRKDINSSIHKGVSIIKQSGEHLLTLITDILDLSKIEAGKLELVPSDFHFKDFVASVADIVKLRAEKKGISFFITYNNNGFAQDDIILSGDTKRLRQVLLNLLINGVKFTTTGSVEFQVDFLSENPHIIHFQVKDTGCGMTEEQIQKIFLPFEQVGDEKKRAEGTGLGLPITKKLLEMMGGFLVVESESGKGSTFSFDLTFNQGESGGIERVMNDEKIMGYRGEERTILVVDDKEHNREIIKDFLIPLGFNVVIRGNGKEGIDLVREKRPDCVIMDMMMPVMDGFEAVRELRKDPDYADLFILGVSASIFKKDILKIREAGCNDFLPKPIVLNSLLKIIGSNLELEWKYEKQEIERAQDSDIMYPPKELIDLFIDLASMGKVRKLLREVEKLETEDPRFVSFARVIKELAESFDDSGITDFLNQNI